MKLPQLIYGTAWNKERTTDLVYKALCAGYRGLDTADLPQHYNQRGTGTAIKRWTDSQDGRRDDLFVQSKLAIPTPPDTSPPSTQQEWNDRIQQSLESSLKELDLDYMDSYLLHLPTGEYDKLHEAWRAFEALQESGKVRHIGISNVSKRADLESLHKEASTKPSWVQNRFYPRTNYDSEIRDFCAQSDIHYQSYWTLTRNRTLIDMFPETEGMSREQIFLRFVMDLGIVPVTTTTSEQHMKDDLDVIDHSPLSDEDTEAIKKGMDYYRMQVNRLSPPRRRKTSMYIE